MDSGTIAHIHLLLNHFPTVGTVVGLALFVLSFIRDSEALKRASLEVFFLIALATVATYATGVAAQSAIKDRPGISKASIEKHEDAAMLAFTFMELTGFAAWIGLWQFRRLSRSSRVNSAAVMTLTIVSLILMTRAANVGGGIRHPEILVGQEATSDQAAASEPAAWLTSVAVHDFVNNNKWVWPACETFHFVGLSLVFGILALVNLRMLGLFREVSFADVHRLLPWAMLGLAVNVFTGMLFFIGSPLQYTTNVMFHWKIAFLMVAGVNLLCTTVSDRAWAVQSGDNPPLTVKGVAASSMVLWAGVMYCGRMLAFIGGSF